MWSSLPLIHIFRKRLLRSVPRSIESVAVRSWEIAPAEAAISKPAFFLPDQLDRVSGWAFATEHPRRDMNGGVKGMHGATRAFLITDAWLIDGALYKGFASSHLQPRSRRFLKLQASVELDRGAVYCTAEANKYFGQWLLDDCVTYALAAKEGTPVTTDQAVSAHAMDYESRFGMKPSRLGGVYFRELLVFNDRGDNRSKSARFGANREKLLSGVNVEPHPGVFILRGRAGELRLMSNELELAERLRERRGFRILDPMQTDVSNIVATCAGARVVMGIEGSQLVHGMLLLQRGGSLVTLQPPNRFVKMLKCVTDREGQNFGFVVGIPDGMGFRIDPEEAERTLDLLPP